MTLTFGFIRRISCAATTSTTGCHIPASTLVVQGLRGGGLRPSLNPKNVVARSFMTSMTRNDISDMTTIGCSLMNTNTNRASIGIKYMNSCTILPTWRYHRWNQGSPNRLYYSSKSSYTNAPPPLSPVQQPFVPMTPQEEENEKLRISQLSPTEKDMELRQLNRQIAVLEKKRGINTGELYTWSGKYKALARDYGMPLMVWYWAIWISTGILCYTTITLFDVDVMYLLQQIDLRTGYAISEQVNPEYGKIGMALVVNEIIEPIRLPIVIVTVKPVIDRLFPPKY